MQTIRSHRSWVGVKKIIDEGYSQEAYDRFDKLQEWQQLKAEGCFEETIVTVLKVSRATLFRWQKSYNLYGLEGLQNASRRPDKIRQSIKQIDIESKVLALRRKYPIFGKYKIQIMLQEEYKIYASVSTVGYILQRLIKQRKVVSVANLCGKKTPLKQRRFDGHAQRFRFEKAQSPGEMMQVDHMVEGHYKHFAAICPVTKLVFAQVYAKATSAYGAQFLQEMILFFPFKISSIQVDGGGEFMADFEQLCKKMDIKLYVLPPRSPKLNGTVERSNGTFHYEFYALNPQFNKIDEISVALARFVAFYNEKRPHQRLNYLTPMRYFNNWKEKQHVSVSYV